MIREDQYAGALMTIKSLQLQLEEAKRENAALRKENVTLKKMWKEANRLLLTWCPGAVKDPKDAQP